MNQLRELNLTKNKPKFPRRLTQLEESTTYPRKTIGQLTVIVKCKQTNTYSKHQKSLLEKFRKKLETPHCLIYNQTFISRNKN